MTTVGQAQRRRDRRRRIALLVGTVGLVAAFGVQLVLLIPTTYTATSAVALRPLTAEVTSEVLELQAHEYGVALGAPETSAAVQQESSSRTSAGVVVRTVQEPGTATLRIIVDSTNRGAAIDVANQLADQAVALGEGDTTTQVVEVVAASSAGLAAVPPRLLYIGTLLCLAGLVLAGGLYRIRDSS